MHIYKLHLRFLCLSLATMKKAANRCSLHLLKKDHWLKKKWFFIFIQGCLLRGGILSLVVTVLTELSYSSFAFNDHFFSRFPSRLLVNSSLLMLAGIGLGHWLWTLHMHQKELTERIQSQTRTSAL